jgi:cytochrome oxidase assembly protein ShyY1
MQQRPRSTRRRQDPAIEPRRPRAAPTLVALVVVATTIGLGVWQVQRHLGAEVERSRVAAQLAAEPLTAPPSATDPLPVRTHLTGCYAEGPLALITGGLHEGEPGYRLFQPYVTAAGPTVLVDRGWIPAELPPDAVARLATPACEPLDGLAIPLTGATTTPPTELAPGLTRWAMQSDLLWGVLPRVLGPPLIDLAARLDGEVASVAVLRGPEIDDPRERPRSQAPVGGYMVPVSRIHHRSYAAQWFAIAGITLLLWLWDWRVRRPRSRDRGARS